MPGGVAVGACAGDVFAEVGTGLVGEMYVEVAIGAPAVGAGLAASGEQALKNRLTAAEPRQASTSRKKSRREILFIHYLHHHGYSKIKGVLIVIPLYYLAKKPGMNRGCLIVWARPRLSPRSTPYPSGMLREEHRENLFKISVNSVFFTPALAGGARVIPFRGPW